MRREGAVGNGPRIAVIGLGGFGRLHLQALLDLGRPPVAVADPDAGRVHDAAREVRGWTGRHVECFNDPLLLLEQTQLDAVIVASPNPTHAGFTLAALDRGLRVLVEKPVTGSVVEARQILATGRAGDVLPGHVLRFSEPHRRVVGEIRRGAIGTITRIRARRDREQGHVRYGEPDPVFLTQIHDLDLAAWISGEVPTRVTTDFGYDGDLATEAVTRATTAGGIEWEITSTWSLEPGAAGRDELVVDGERGRLRLRVDGGRTVVEVLDRSGGRTTIEDLADTAAPGLLAEVAEFVEATAGDRPFAGTDFAEAAAVIAVAEAARRSGTTGGRDEVVEEVRAR